MTSSKKAIAVKSGAKSKLKNDSSNKEIDPDGYEEVEIDETNIHEILESMFLSNRLIEEKIIVSHLDGKAPYLGDCDDPFYDQGHTILKYFVSKLTEGTPLTREASDFLLVAFQNILGGEDASVALKLKRNPGRQATPEKAIRDIILGNLVINFMREGVTYENAIEKTARILDPDNPNSPEAIVEKAYKDFKKSLPPNK